MHRIAFALVALWAASAEAWGADASPSPAGEAATVCGVVASAHYAASARGQPTFLDFGKPHPNEEFTAVIFGDDRAKFGQPERLRGKRVCVTGTIELYRGKPEIILHDPRQLRQE